GEGRGVLPLVADPDCLLRIVCRVDPLASRAGRHGISVGPDGQLLEDSVPREALLRVQASGSPDRVAPGRAPGPGCCDAWAPGPTDVLLPLCVFHAPDGRRHRRA